MIWIEKNNEPAYLKKLQQKSSQKNLSSAESYKLLKGKKKHSIRQILVEEQGSLCAYCMCRIPRTDVDKGIAQITIEHIVPQHSSDTANNNQGLDYYNLVAVCNGNRTKRGNHKINDLTCDAHKGNIEFRRIDPTKLSTLTSICYTLDGKIDATDPDVRFDLIETLNLNCPTSPLIAERKAALDSLIEEIDYVGDENIIKYCALVYDSLLAESNPKTPYRGILLWYLETILDHK